MRATLLLTAASMFGCTSKTALDGADSPTVDSELDSDSESHHSDSAPDSHDSDSHADSRVDTDTDTDTGTDTDSDSAHDSDTGDTDPAPVTLDWVLIPAQTFQMGCTASQYDCGTEETQHTVTLTHALYIANLEVTHGEYFVATGERPSYFDACGMDCPVEYASWEDAAAYANWLSDSEGLDDCYTCDGTTCIPLGSYTCTGYRLPTEAEWEAATRCGTDYTYAGSDTVEDVAWFLDNAGWGAGYGPRPGGQLAPNDCGLYDMSGNVFEWVQDTYDGDYGAEARTDPELDLGPANDRIARGGAWDQLAPSEEVGFRTQSWPYYGSYTLGFRLARTAP